MSISRKPGDWDCRACQHLNFRSRDSCQCCGEPKLGVDYGGRLAGADIVKPGDWYCMCGVHNFASRSNCFKCGACKDNSTALTASVGFQPAKLRQEVHGFNDRPVFKSGDWICTRPGCNEHNFASRMECFRCKAPRAYDYFGG